MFFIMGVPVCERWSDKEEGAFLRGMATVENLCQVNTNRVIESVLSSKFGNAFLKLAVFF